MTDLAVGAAFSEPVPTLVPMLWQSMAVFLVILDMASELLTWPCESLQTRTQQACLQQLVCSQVLGL